jgi:hypothetical protein
MLDGNLHNLRAVVALGHMDCSSTTMTSGTGTHRGHREAGTGRMAQVEWHRSHSSEVYICGESSHGMDRAPNRSMARTLTFALVSILFVGCGTSSTNGPADTTAGAGGAGTGSAGGGSGAGRAGAPTAGAGSGGASTAAGAAGADSGGASSGGAGAGSGGGGPLSCGSQTCGATQYCVNPCCGGNAPACMAKPDGGTCPAGTHPGCSNGVQCMNPSDCCQSDPCTPPAPYCSDKVPVGCLLEGRTCRMVCA